MHLHLFPWDTFLDVEMFGQRICIFKRLLNYRMLVNYPGNLIWAWYSLVAVKGYSDICLICLIKLSLSSVEVNVMKTLWLFHKCKHSFAFKGLFIGHAVYAQLEFSIMTDYPEGLGSASSQLYPSLPFFFFSFCLLKLRLCVQTFGSTIWGRSRVGPLLRSVAFIPVHSKPSLRLWNRSLPISWILPNAF